MTEVQHSVARYLPTDDGVFANVKTNGLAAGTVYTRWFVAISNLDAREDGKCTSKDVLKRSDIVQSDAGYSGGAIADESVKVNFAWLQPNGNLEGGWLDRGLLARRVGIPAS